VLVHFGLDVGGGREFLLALIITAELNLSSACGEADQ